MSPEIRRPDALEPPVVVADAEGLARLLADLADQDQLAVDTEANSFYRYHERVCLIQISANGTDWLVDPLADLDLEPLGRILADPTKTKIFHDAEYDVLLLKRDRGWSLGGLFDTRAAAAALGHELPGLASVVSARFGIELDKSQQRSDWTRRPLSPQQIAYARLDTHYLIALADELRRELRERGRERIVEGECRRLEALEAAPLAFDPDGWVRVKGARKLDPAARSALRELFRMRDQLASQRDVPPFKVIGNAELLALAGARPTSQRELAEVPRLSPRITKRIGRDLLAAVARAAEAGPLASFPRTASRDPAGRLDEESGELHERLKEWRKRQASGEGIDSSLVLNRHVLARLAAARPTDAQALARVDGMLEWQLEMFTDELVALVAAFEEDLAAGRIELRRGGHRRGR